MTTPDDIRQSSRRVRGEPASSFLKQLKALTRWLCLPTHGGGPVSPKAPRRRDIIVALLIVSSAFLVYNANMRTIAAGDTYAARYLPLSIWRHHSLNLDPIADTVAQGRQLPSRPEQTTGAYWVAKGPDGRLVPRYPILLPLVVTPLYAPAVVYLNAHDWEPGRVEEVARLMEKLCASLLASLSVGLLYCLLRRRLSMREAASLTLIYAFCTTTWMISSQAFWTHGLAQVLITSALLLMTGRPTALRIGLAGLLCGLIAANRQPDAVLAAGLGLYGLWWGRRHLLLLITTAVIPGLLTLAYNLRFMGDVLGGYGLDLRPENFNDNLLEGVAGLLVSPTHGLFVFSPFLLFLLWRFPTIFRDQATRALSVSLAGAIIVQLMVYAATDWRQGVSFGPRWFTDMLPILMWMLAPVAAALSARAHLVFSMACGVGIAIQAGGAFWYTGAGDIVIMAGQGPDRMQAAWEVRNAPYVADMDHSPIPPDLLVDVKGNVEVLRITRRDGDDGPIRELEFSGWALANGRTPESVSVIIDGTRHAGISDLTPRPDVSIDAAAGWRIVLPAEDLSPGLHRASVMVRARRGGEPRLLLHRTFTIEAQPPLSGDTFLLSVAARRAAAALRERQQSSGFWLTDFTDSPTFGAPQVELNTYVNAMILDVAGPVAAAAEIAPALESARAFLTRQIEGNGLVRYHGLPDAPGIGVLGCAITPDADDTALVWRAAPDADRTRLMPAIAEMKRYRRPDGLYRTWLAPRDRYECLDPGRDPNPADLTIQMHVYLMLAKEAPGDARDLCRALIGRTDEEALWSYYDLSPTAPIYRLADMRRAGCGLTLPPQRMRARIDGQEPWVHAAALIQRLDGSSPSAAATEEAERLLREIARDDFALMQQHPPLLYHNDQTATVSRFYWSRDFGYALWLRLYHQIRQERAAE